jgi:tetratricopeptide (TPR) repeat protein
MATAGFAVGKSYVSLLETALRSHPEDPRLTMLLGVSAFLQDDPVAWTAGEIRVEKALRKWKNNDQLRHETAYAFNNMAVHFKGITRLDRAADLYIRSLNLRPAYPMALTSLGNIRYSQGKPEEAIRLLPKAVSTDPQYAPELQNLGNILFVQGKREDAIEIFRQAVQVSPNHADLHFKLGLALHVQSRFQEAITTFSQAAQLSPTGVEVHLWLGRTYEKLNRKSEAMRSYRKALTLDPRNIDASDRIAQLQTTTP